MEKNVAGKWAVYAFGDSGHANPGDPITGDAANITANIRIDGAAANAVDDTNPAELEDGYYIFDITAVEANGDNLVLCPASATANVTVVGTPGALWTRPPYFAALPILGACATGTLTTTIFTTGLGGVYTTDDALNGRSILFTGGVTAALNGQGGVISSYTAATGEITIASPLTTAPANLEPFVIV